MSEETNNNIKLVNQPDSLLRTPSNYQPETSSTQQHQNVASNDENTMPLCFNNILKTFTRKQANILSNFADINQKVSQKT